ncbi:MAG: hypothetical protein L0287_09980 [Anaerolineae bacterium]|nr:hypothetical protein [Anaerolineae bacterium]
MAGWTSFSDFINEVTANGKYLNSTFMKVSSNAAALAAGRWAEAYTWTGIPGAGPQTGTAGTGANIAQSIQGTGINIGANVSPDIRSLLTLQAFSSESTLVPAIAWLVDYLVYWPSLVVTGSPTTLVAAALGRYTDGLGVMAMASVQTALGAAQPALTLTCTYDDNSSAAAPFALTAPANSLPISSLFQYNGTPFMPLPVGKKGVKAVTSYSLASGTTGTVCFFLVKPLALIPILAVNTATERDLMVQLPSMPRVVDDAHLGFIIQVGGAMAASAPFGGMIGMGWG